MSTHLRSLVEYGEPYLTLQLAWSKTWTVKLKMKKKTVLIPETVITV